MKFSYFLFRLIHVVRRCYIFFRLCGGLTIVSRPQYLNFSERELIICIFRAFHMIIFQLGKNRLQLFLNNNWFMMNLLMYNNTFTIKIIEQIPHLILLAISSHLFPTILGRIVFLIKWYTALGEISINPVQRIFFLMFALRTSLITFANDLYFHI